MPVRVRRDYGSPVHTPMIYPVSYLIIVITLAYALGVQVVTPLDSSPTGYATANPQTLEDNAPESTKVSGHVNSFKQAATPPPFKDRPHTVSTGFNMIQPIGVNARMDGERTLEVRFIKVAPTSIEIKEVKIVNALTGGGCAAIDTESELAANQDTFNVAAKSCDTSASEGSEGILTYNVTIEYSILIGSEKTTHKNTGQIRIWA